MPKTLRINTTQGPFFRGIGDSILLSWVVEGAKGSDVELSVYANGTKRDVLEMLGVPVHDMPVGISLSDIPIFDMEDYGSKPRAERICQVLGLETAPKRPSVKIPCWAKYHANDFWRNTPLKRILLCDEVSDHSREWPWWSQLAEMLLEKPCDVRRLYSDREDHYALAAAKIAAADLVIAVDSSHAHMAATIGVNTIVLLGPTRWNVFAHAENVVCLSTPTELQACSGCCFNYSKFSSMCRHMGCAALSLIRAESVFDAVAKLAFSPR